MALRCSDRRMHDFRSGGLIQIKVILFDIDGTLVDTNDMHVLAWEKAFPTVRASFDRQVIHDQIGKGTEMLAPTLLPDVDEDQQGQLGDTHGAIFKAKYLETAKPFAQGHDLLAHAHGLGQSRTDERASEVGKQGRACEWPTMGRRTPNLCDRECNA